MEHCVKRNFYVIVEGGFLEYILFSKKYVKITRMRKHQVFFICNCVRLSTVYPPLSGYFSVYSTMGDDKNTSMYVQKIDTGENRNDHSTSYYVTFVITRIIC